MTTADVEAVAAFAARLAEVRRACEQFATWHAAVQAATARFRALREAGSRWPT
jgi:hypothetical protein